MGLQVDVVEDPADRPGADGGHDAVGDGLVGQVLTGPMSDVQPSGPGLQARQRHDLGALEGGNRDAASRSLGAPIGEQPRQAIASITTAGPPDRDLLALHLVGDGLGPLTVGDRQDDPRPLHLEPR
jgi:hypothetical protein